MTSPNQTDIILTDALGSVLASFSNTYNNAALLGNQIYGPYGSQNYQSGSMGTNKGFTGHYADATGLDYYNARYYDPIAGVFLSADTVQGMNPYGYVQGTPKRKAIRQGSMWCAGRLVAMAQHLLPIHQRRPHLLQSRSRETGYASVNSMVVDKY